VGRRFLATEEALAMDAEEEAGWRQGLALVKIAISKYGEEMPDDLFLALTDQCEAVRNHLAARSNQTLDEVAAAIKRVNAVLEALQKEDEG
jgi:hypothetical protein